MKQYRVGIFASINVDALDEESARAQARDILLSGAVRLREFEFEVQDRENDLPFTLMPVEASLAFDEYEKVARMHRPDWDKYLVEAEDDPAEIAGEVLEIWKFTHIGNPTDALINDVYKHVRSWIALQKHLAETAKQNQGAEQ